MSIHFTHISYNIQYLNLWYIYAKCNNSTHLISWSVLLDILRPSQIWYGIMFYGIVFQGAPKHTYIYIYWSLTFLSLSRKLDMYPKSDVLSSSVRLKHYIFKRLYIIFTHTHTYTYHQCYLNVNPKNCFSWTPMGSPKKNIVGRFRSLWVIPQPALRRCGTVHLIQWITHGVTTNFKGPMENGCASKLKTLSGTTIGHHWPSNSSSQGAQHISGLKMLGSKILEVKHGKTVSRLEMTMVF